MYGRTNICSCNRFLSTEELTVNARTGFSVSVFVSFVIRFEVSSVRRKSADTITSQLKQVRKCEQSGKIRPRSSETGP